MKLRTGLRRHAMKLLALANTQRDWAINRHHLVFLRTQYAGLLTLAACILAAPVLVRPPP